MGGSILAGLRRIRRRVAGMRGIASPPRDVQRTADSVFRLCRRSYGGRVGSDPPLLRALSLRWIAA
jgi:hypothetical protein